MFTTPPCRKPTADAPHAGAAFQLRFPSLFQSGHSLTFPCDSSGCVVLD